MTISCPENDTVGVCATMDSAGAGLGIFIDYMGTALPTLLIILVLVGVISAIGIGIAYVIKGSIQKVATR